MSEYTSADGNSHDKNAALFKEKRRRDRKVRHSYGHSFCIVIWRLFLFCAVGVQDVPAALVELCEHLSGIIVGQDAIENETSFRLRWLQAVQSYVDRASSHSHEKSDAVPMLSVCRNGFAICKKTMAVTSALLTDEGHDALLTALSRLLTPQNEQPRHTAVDDEPQERQQYSVRPQRDDDVGGSDVVDDVASVDALPMTFPHSHSRVVEEVSSEHVDMPASSLDSLALSADDDEVDYAFARQISASVMSIDTGTRRDTDSNGHSRPTSTADANHYDHDGCGGGGQDNANDDHDHDDDDDDGDGDGDAVQDDGDDDDNDDDDAIMPSYASTPVGTKEQSAPSGGGVLVDHSVDAGADADADAVSYALPRRHSNARAEIASATTAAASQSNIADVMKERCVDGAATTAVEAKSLATRRSRSRAEQMTMSIVEKAIEWMDGFDPVSSRKTTRSLLELYPSIASIFPMAMSSSSSKQTQTLAMTTKTILECMQMQVSVYEEWLEVMADYATVFCADERGIVETECDDRSLSAAASGNLAVRFMCLIMIMIPQR